jgi:hypothetical protein
MRVRLIYTSFGETLSPCGTTVYGEVEDYTILIPNPESKYSGGDGTCENPYRIATAADLNDIGNHTEDLNKCFVLINDINLAAFRGTQFNMIGIHNWSIPSVPFTGVFDGNDCTISSFTYSFNGTKQEYIGIFGYVTGSSAEIKNLTVTDCNVDSGEYGVRESAVVGRISGGVIVIRNCRAVGGIVRADGFDAGGLVGGKAGGLVTHCYSNVQVINPTGRAGGLVSSNYSGEISYSVSESTVFGRDDVGGLVGTNPSSGTIRYCSANATVLGTQQVGGLVGENYGTIVQCCSEGSVEAASDEAGGLVGRCLAGVISDSHSTSSATSAGNAGGFTALNWGGSIIRCYAAGMVSGDFWSGAFAGYHIEGSYTECFWDSDVSPLAGISNITDPEVSGLYTVEMRQESSFTDAGWDFVGENVNGSADIWVIRELVDYPKLARTGNYGGYGTSSYPYLIYMPEQMNGIGVRKNDWNKHFMLMADLDMSMYSCSEYNVIGNDFSSPFRGSFDGKDHIIRNFTYTNPNAYYGGLFGRINNASSVIRDVGLISPYVKVSTSGSGGSLVSWLFEGKVIDCWAEDVYVEGWFSAGGLVGFSWYGGLYNCHTSGTVKGDVWVGGLTGSLASGIASFCNSSCAIIGVQECGGLIGDSGGIVSDCYATGNVQASDRTAGGFLGANTGFTTRCSGFGNATSDDEAGGFAGRNLGDINDCYSMGDSSGIWDIGGFVGLNWGGVIMRTYSTGFANGIFSVGGLVGKSLGGTTLDSFWDIGSGSPDNGIGTGLTTAQMQTQASFTSAGWDFVSESSNGNEDIWRMCVDIVEYPKFRWEFGEGDFLCPDGVDGIDYSFFASHWGEINCGDSNDCDGADFDFSGEVDWMDLKILCNNW